MKKLLLLLTVIGSVAINYAQVSHNLLATDFSFDPDTLYVSPGDTVEVLIQGYHSATEIDSLDWVNNVDNHNGGFDVGFGAATSDDWFVLTTVGTHYYICEPHAAMGMKGVIIVQNGLSLPEQFNPNNFQVIQMNKGDINLKYEDANQLDVFDLSGKHVYTCSLNLEANQQNILSQFNNGVYMFRFSKDNQLRVVKKAVIVSL